MPKLRQNVKKAMDKVDNPKRGTMKAKPRAAATKKKSGYSITAPRAGNKRKSYGMKMGKPALKGGKY